MFLSAKKSTQTFFVQSFSTTLRVMDVRAENRGRPHQKVRFPAAPVVGRNFLTPGHPGVRVRNVRGKSGPKSLCLCCFFFPEFWHQRKHCILVVYVDDFRVSDPDGAVQTLCHKNWRMSKHGSGAKTAHRKNHRIFLKTRWTTGCPWDTQSVSRHIAFFFPFL